ncbi:MAG: hypothetical protein JWQ75_3823 [Pseudarthrobacter sp.]|nr:hypothetical protein [Pseudarthrobacter sp.]
MSWTDEGRFTVVQLSDIHLVRDSGLLHGRLDTWQRTVEALGAAAHFKPDAVLVTGDISNAGDECYQRAAVLFEQASEQLGCPVIVLPGNHDMDLSGFRRFNPFRTLAGPLPGDTVHVVRGLRLITLNSQGLGTPHGALQDVQLEWLTAILAGPSEHGTILALHHPPVNSPLPQLRGRGLARPEVLASALQDTDVRAVLSGHYHHGLSAVLGRIPVWVSPAVSYNQNLFAPPGTVQGIDSSWFSVIQLEPDAFTATPVPVTAGHPVFTSTVFSSTANPLPQENLLHTFQGAS